MRLRSSTWKWFLWAVFLAGGVAFAALSPEASGSKSDVPYTGVRVHVSAAATVDMRALARLSAHPEPAGPPWRQVAASYCRLWNVRRVKSPRSRGRVVRQSPGPGQIRRSDARVSLTIGR